MGSMKDSGYVPVRQTVRDVAANPGAKKINAQHLLLLHTSKSYMLTRLYFPRCCSVFLHLSLSTLSCKNMQKRFGTFFKICLKGPKISKISV